LPAGNRIVALEPETGKEIWHYDLPASARASFRGVTYWPGEGRTKARIVFTSGRNLMAVDAATGKPSEGFGINGVQDITIGYAGVPIIYKNMIFVGATIFGPGEQHVDSGTTRASFPALNSRAFDARTGKKIWEFHSVPQPGEFGNETWLNDSWKDRTGTNVWGITLTLDERRGIVYLPIGGANYNYYGGDRPGDNLFANTLVAVDATTGKRKWHFQTVHHELWDYDLPPAPSLFDITKDGKTIPVLAQTGKLGLMFILNRETGAPVYPIEERPVPQGDVPGEKYSPTQPFPVKPPPIARLGITKDDIVTAADTTPEHAKACRELFEKNTFYNVGPYTPWRMKADGVAPTLAFPGFTGGPNWGGTAVDVRTGYVFVNTKDAPGGGVIEKNPRYNESTKNTELPYVRTGGANFSAPAVDENGKNLGNLPCYRPPWASLVAVNATTGDIAWKVPLGINDNMPEGKKNVGSAGSGGPIATAGGLVFIGATGDRRFRAFDSKTGKELWYAPVDNTITATPLTYQGNNGKQYVAVVAASGGAGGRGRGGPAPPSTESVVVFALP
jgi:quinoprotein glucose dehydrogenase